MTIIVAHRLSTVVHADRIVVLERGRIAEADSHASLVASGGLYAAMWREQTPAALDGVIPSRTDGEGSRAVRR